METYEVVIKSCLAWCNEKRKEYGKEPLTDLPKGRIGDPRSCPCGTATGLYVSRTLYSPVDEYGNRTGSFHTLPREVTRFIELFDEGSIPELVEK